MGELLELREPSEFISTSKNDQEIVFFLNNLFREAAREGISDIHFEDMESDSRVRIRKDGKLTEHIRLPRRTARDAQDKIRKKSNIPPSETKRAMDGQLFFEVDKRIVDVRVNIYPTNYGHSVVCRLLDQNNAQRTLEEIDMRSELRDEISRILFSPEGLLLISGPTGSGKTSTLYAALNKVNTIDRKIITVEDPVEYRLDGLTQGPVSKYLTFADALRAMMRQDPDVALVGEIRDTVTARAATEMALTGHVVLSTVHANNAPATISRMMDLGVDPYNLSTGLKSVLAQRLARRLCHCAIERKPTNYESRWLDAYGLAYEGERVYSANQEGCSDCNSGYAGRIPVFEMMNITPDVRELVADGAPAAAIEEASAIQPQYRHLGAAAMDLCAERKVPIEEVIRIGGREKMAGLEAG